MSSLSTLSGTGIHPKHNDIFSAKQQAPKQSPRHHRKLLWFGTSNSSMPLLVDSKPTPGCSTRLLGENLKGSSVRSSVVDFIKRSPWRKTLRRGLLGKWGVENFFKKLFCCVVYCFFWHFDSSGFVSQNEFSSEFGERWGDHDRSIQRMIYLFRVNPDSLGGDVLVEAGVREGPNVMSKVQDWKG